MTMEDILSQLLQRSAARHSHLCPRQVLGVRIGLAGAAALELELPRNDKRLLVIVETDGCFADGIEVATGCTVGHRTLKVVDYGKIAATFVDTRTEKGVRVAPAKDVRQLAIRYSPGEGRHYFAQLRGYQIMPTEELLTFQTVSLWTPIQAILGRAGVRVSCDICGEEIINEREIRINGLTLCRGCAGGAYYQIEPLNDKVIFVNVHKREKLGIPT